MLRPIATRVTPAQDHTLVISFDSGETKVFDVKPYIKGEWYKELEDELYFNTVFVNGYTVEWPNGQDLCPDEIYYCSIPFIPAV